MSEEPFSLPDRRDFARAAGGVLGWTWLSAHYPAAVRAATEAHRIACGEVSPTLEFLTEEEFAEVDALSALIIPTDDLPGAREAGSAWFVDRALARFMAPVANGFRLGLIELGKLRRNAHPESSSLSDLEEADAIAFLRGVDETPFFGLAWNLIVWGTFALPEHGGNRDRTGWSIIGFEDRHAWHPPFGYYDRDAHGEGR